MLVDPQFEIKTIEKVESGEGGWLLTFQDGFSFWCPDNGVEPKRGDEARLYGRGIGYPVRGLFVNGRKVFYRTREEEEERHRRWVADKERMDKERFEKIRSDLDAQYNALPTIFKERIDGFRQHNRDWRWKNEEYEMTVCVDAVNIAKTLLDEAKVRDFADQPWEVQRKIVPELSEGHSGNSFGAACQLAVIYIAQPELVPKAHGALCPLVGCKEYGCWAGRSERGSIP